MSQRHLPIHTDGQSEEKFSQVLMRLKEYINQRKLDLKTLDSNWEKMLHGQMLQEQIIPRQ